MVIFFFQYEKNFQPLLLQNWEVPKLQRQVSLNSAAFQFLAHAYSLMKPYGIFLDEYCKFRNFQKGFIFADVKIKPSQKGEITLLFIDVGKSGPILAKFLTSKILF